MTNQSTWMTNRSIIITGQPINRYQLANKLVVLQQIVDRQQLIGQFSQPVDQDFLNLDMLVIKST